MFDVILLAINEVLYYPSRFLSYLQSSIPGLRTMFVISICLGIIFIAFKIIKSVIWDR